jgi:outer membrane protein
LKKNLVPFSLLALGCAALMQAQAPASSPAKVATIHVQSAIMNTTAGKKAAGDLTNKFNPRKQEIEKKQSDVVALQEQLKRGSATMNQETRDKLTRDIDAGQKNLQRLGEDFDADLQQEEGKIMNDLGQKMMDIIIKHATQNGFAMVIDVSNPQTPVLWADPSADITQEIVKQYDAAHPAGAAAPAAKPPAVSAPKQATPPPAAPKSVIPPPGKKQ